MPVLHVLIFIAALLAIKSAAVTQKPMEKPRKYTFKDFIEKYSAATAWEQIDKERLEGANYTLEQETEKFMNAIDPTDELLKLNVPNGNAKVIVSKSGRRWMPKQGPPTVGYGKDKNTGDQFQNKDRVVELMKQAIYQARNKMVIMQKLRAEFRNHSSYKMGYLMAKTDFATKILAQFAFRAMRACTTKRQMRLDLIFMKYKFLEIIYTQEKQMHLWFEVDLLTDLVLTNHLIAQRVTNKRKITNQKLWRERFVN